MSLLTLHVIAVVFIATLIRSTLGFGEALVAVPLLALRLPVEIAAPLAVLVSITVSIIVTFQESHHIHRRAAGWLAAWTLVGIPLGLYALTHVNGRAVKGTLGVLIAAFALWSLLNRIRLELTRDSLPWLCGVGLTAGVLGGAYGMNGPPLVIYGSLRRWSSAQFRATLQGYFLPASLAGMAGYWAAGLWVPAVTRLFLMSLPASLVATFLGRAVHARIPAGAFYKYVYVGLLAVGVTLLVQAARGS